MNDQKLKSFSILILSISILISSVIISNSLKNIDDNKILTIEQAAKYMTISTEELDHLVKKTPAKIPYLKVSDKYIFTKKGLDEWLANNQW